MLHGAIEHYDAGWTELTADGPPFAVTEIEVRGNPVLVFANTCRTCQRRGNSPLSTATSPISCSRTSALRMPTIDARLRALAHLLRHEHGVGSGDRVAIAMCTPTWFRHSQRPRTANGKLLKRELRQELTGS